MSNIISKNKPSFIHLKISIQGAEYLLGTLSFNPSKEECSYHLHHPHDAPALHFNCDTGERTARFEHITWHRNVAHLKREDDVAIERIELSQGPLFCNPPVTTPVYVESLYFQDAKPCLREVNHFKPWKGSQSQEILKLTSSVGFSVVFLLVPSNIESASILIGIQFLEIPEGMDCPPCLVDICDLNHRTGRIRLWSGWDFLIITSPITCRILSPVPPAIGNSYRLPNFQNVQSALRDLLLQANGRS